MSLEIAYAAMGGDLETVRGRLLTDERIEKFAKIFLQDTSMQTLESALEAGDLPEAYRGAHTLKGVSRDLGFTPLFEAAHAHVPRGETGEKPDSGPDARLAPADGRGLRMRPFDGGGTVLSSSFLCRRMSSGLLCRRIRGTGPSAPRYLRSLQRFAEHRNGRVGDDERRRSHDGPVRRESGEPHP